VIAPKCLARGRTSRKVTSERAAGAAETARSARRASRRGLSTSIEVIEALDLWTQAKFGLEQARAA
jgi:hypothetical protein